MILKGKNAVITGCNRGIGKATLEKFAENGCNIFAVIRTLTDDFKDYVDEIKVRCNVDICIIIADYADEIKVKEAAKEILSYKKPIDILVNNAGTDYNQSAFLMSKMKTMHDTFQVNYFSHIYLTQQISKSMVRNKKGSVIFVSSAAAFDGGANVQYSSSKAALLGASKRMALEFGNFNIRVNCVAPGLIDTDLTRDLREDDLSKAMEMTMLQRKGEPEEIANVIMFLASDLSTFVTGQVIHADGGIR